jgi:hypothetical protein
MELAFLDVVRGCDDRDLRLNHALRLWRRTLQGWRHEIASTLTGYRDARGKLDRAIQKRNEVRQRVEQLSDELNSLRESCASLPTGVPPAIQAELRDIEVQIVALHERLLEEDCEIPREGEIEGAEASLTLSQRFESSILADLAQSALWRGDAGGAQQILEHAADSPQYGLPRLTRLQGEAALMLDRLEHADERLHQALAAARAGNHTEEELAATTALAALHQRRGDTMRAREYLDAIWGAAERGPFPLLHTDARNLLTKIELADGNIPAAVKAATAAYRLAWCDGPPFAYDYGLRTARAHLAALGAPEPQLPPYDPSKHEPIEEIDIEVIGRELDEIKPARGDEGEPV